jgi:hypothetical protein
MRRKASASPGSSVVVSEATAREDGSHFAVDAQARATNGRQVRIREAISPQSAASANVKTR